MYVIVFVFNSFKNILAFGELNKMENTSRYTFYTSIFVSKDKAQHTKI